MWTPPCQQPKFNITKRNQLPRQQQRAIEHRASPERLSPPDNNAIGERGELIHYLAFPVDGCALLWFAIVPAKLFAAPDEAISIL